MTDNEKVATFIGWLPHVTAGHRNPCDCTPAPDMSDPRNYMKALEAIDSSWSIQHDRLAHRRMVTFATQMGTWDDSVPTATAIVTALAALYDAKHQS